MRARFLLIPLLAAAALLAGCATNTPQPAATDNGVSALTAEEILAKAQAAIGAATSYRIKGAVTEEGSTVNADLVFVGKDFKGTVTTNGVSIELIRIGNDLYMKAPDDFWKSQIPAGQADAVLLLLKGKYVKISATSPSAAGLADLDASSFLKPDGAVTKGDAKVVNGQPTIAVKGQDGSLFVATTGQPYPIRLEATDGQGMDFSDYNAANEIKAPGASEVFDLSALLGG